MVKHAQYMYLNTLRKLLGAFPRESGSAGSGLGFVEFELPRPVTWECGAVASQPTEPAATLELLPYAGPEVRSPLDTHLLCLQGPRTLLEATWEHLQAIRSLAARVGGRVATGAGEEYALELAVKEAEFDEHGLIIPCLFTRSGRSLAAEVRAHEATFTRLTMEII